MDNYQIAFGTYTFPNTSFQFVDHRMDIDTPVNEAARRNGADILPGYLKPKMWRINGRIYGNDTGSVHNSLNTMKRALHHAGVGASLFYMTGRYAFAQLAPGGFMAKPADKGLYEYCWDIDALLVSNPFSESVTVTRVSDTRTNNSAATSASPGGNYPASPVFVFVGGTWAFGGSANIRVENVANSLFFQFFGGLAAGQTLLVDCVAGSVMWQVGATMVDAMSYFAGNLTTFVLEPGGANSLIVNAPTLSFYLDFHDRYYV